MRLAAALLLLPLVLTGCSASVDGDGVEVDADVPSIEAPEVPDVDAPDIDAPDVPDVEVTTK